MNDHDYIAHITIPVMCPADELGRVEAVPLEVAHFDGKELPLPCNGCENSCGSDTCYSCMAQVTLAYYRGEIECSKIFRPKRS